MRRIAGDVKKFLQELGWKKSYCGKESGERRGGRENSSAGLAILGNFLGAGTGREHLTLSRPGPRLHEGSAGFFCSTGLCLSCSAP